MPGIAQLTTGVVVKEEHRGPEDGAEHPVVQHPGGIDADQVEQDSPQEICQDAVHHQGSVDSHALGL